MVNNSLDEVLRSLADPNRRRMVERLANGPLAVSEIARPLTMSLPAVMKHVAILQDAGLVQTSKVGRVRTCTLRPEAVRDLETWASAQRAIWEKRLASLGDYLDRPLEPDDPRREDEK